MNIHKELKAHRQIKTKSTFTKWQVAKLSKYFEVYGGTTPSTTNEDYWNGEINWVTPTDVTKLNERIFLETSEKRITKLAVKVSSLKILPKGTLLLSTRATIGFTAINTAPVTINQGMTALLSKDNAKVHSLFYAYYFQRIKKYLEQLGAGSTFKEISRSTMKNLQIPLPPLPEQQKIAEILSTVDKAIEKVKEATHKTQRLKQGLMQRLLTRGIGHRDFKMTEIGRIPKNWYVAKIENLGNVITGKTPPTSNKKYWNGTIPFITPVDMTEDKFVKQTQRKITNEGAQKAGFILPENTVLVVCIGSTIGKTGLTSERCVVNQQINAIICNNNLNSHYVFYALNRRAKLLKTFSGVAAVPIIKKSLFEKFRIPLPPLSEQQKIAEILSTVDQRVELLRQRKAKLERIKKGLMQGLLTGRKRVKLS